MQRATRTFFNAMMVSFSITSVSRLQSGHSKVSSAILEISARFSGCRNNCARERLKHSLNNKKLNSTRSQLYTSRGILTAQSPWWQSCPHMLTSVPSMVLVSNHLLRQGIEEIQF